jgi:hypothetical protein
MRRLAMVVLMVLLTSVFAAPAVLAQPNPNSQVVNSGERNFGATTPGPHCHVNQKSGAVTGAIHEAHLITDATLGTAEIFVAGGC